MKFKYHLSKMSRALINFMLDTHISDFGFEEVSPPLIDQSQAMYNSGQWPKFSDASFVMDTGTRLIPTSEVPLVNLEAGKKHTEGELPIRYTDATYCFRSEAGSAGRHTRGFIRLHQFSKVELVSICTPNQSQRGHELILHAAETILKKKT